MATLPSPKVLREYYEGKGARLDDLALTYEHPNWYKKWFYRTRSSAVLESLDPRPEDRILDVGAGPGYYSRYIHSKGASAVALDLASSCLRQASSGPIGGWAVWGTADSLPFRGSSFSKVLATEVIEHTLNPWKVVSEIARVLMADGVAVISSPSSKSYMDWLYRVKRQFYSYRFNEHLWEFTPEALCALVEEQLDVLDITFANCLVPFPLDSFVMRLPPDAFRSLDRIERLFRAGRGGRRFGWTVIVRAKKR